MSGQHTHLVVNRKESREYNANTVTRVLHCARVLSGSNFWIEYLSRYTKGGLQKLRKRLADCAHGPVLYISKNKTVNCNMQGGAKGQAGIGRCHCHVWGVKRNYHQRRRSLPGVGRFAARGICLIRKTSVRDQLSWYRKSVTAANRGGQAGKKAEQVMLL